MKIYFNVPYGYRNLDINGDEVNVVPRKGDYVDVWTEPRMLCQTSPPKLVELQVRKVLFNNGFSVATVTLAEED